VSRRPGQPPREVTVVRPHGRSHVCLEIMQLAKEELTTAVEHIYSHDGHARALRIGVLCSTQDSGRRPGHGEAAPLDVVGLDSHDRGSILVIPLGVEGCRLHLVACAKVEATQRCLHRGHRVRGSRRGLRPVDQSHQVSDVLGVTPVSPHFLAVRTGWVTVGPASSFSIRRATALQAWPRVTKEKGSIRVGVTPSRRPLYLALSTASAEKFGGSS